MAPDLATDTTPTRMAFLIDPEWPDEVSAFFPDERWNGRDFTAYSHNGQHGPASLEWAKGCRQATPAEYAPCCAS